MSSQFENDPDNAQVRWYRDWALKNGKDTRDYTNEQLTNFLGNHYEKAGLSHDEISSSYGADFSNAYLDLKNRPDPNQSYVDEISSGLKSASYGLASTGMGALGLGAGSLGFDGVEESLMGKAADLSEKAGQDKPTIERASDVRWSNPAEVARFLMGGIGEATPSVVESAGAYLAGGGIGYGIVKHKAKKAVGKIIGDRLEGSAADAVEAVFREGIKAEARRGFATGSLTATAISSIGLGQGEIYTSLYPNTQLDPKDKDYIDPTRAKSIAATFGAVSGGLDFVGAATLLGKLTGAPKEIAKKYYKRLLLGLPEGVFLEGGTEATQEFINIAAEKFGKGQELEFDGQELSRLFDAGVLGAVGGGQFTAIGAIRGPKNTDEDVDPSAPASEDPTTFKQKNLLEDIQEKRGEDARFQPGDSVQVALGGKGTVDRVVGDTAIIKMEDGTLKTNVPMSTLSSPVEIKESDAVVVDVDDDPVAVSNTETYVTPSGKTVPKVKASAPTIDITINGKKVEKVDEQAGRDAELLFKKMQALANIDGVDGMSQNTPRANKTGGFASNSKSQIQLALGEDSGLYRSDTKAILRKAGVLNSSYEWLLGTKLDKEFDLKETERVKKERLEKSNNIDWIEPNKNVEIKRSGGKVGVIKEITSEGMIAVQDASGQITEYEPDQLKPKASPKTKPKVNKELTDLWNNGESTDFWGSSSVTKESEEVLKEPEFLFTKEKDEATGRNTFVAKGNFTFSKDTKVKLLWTTGKNKKQSKDVSASSVEELSNSVRDFMKAKLNTQHGKKFSDTFYGVEIDGKTYNASIETGYYDIAGLEIDNSQRQELDSQKGDIPFPILSIGIDEESGDFGKGIDSESRPQGNTLKENMTRDSSTVVTLVLKQLNDNDKYPHDSIRVVTARLGRSLNLDGLIKAYNSDSGKYIRINGTPGSSVTSDTFNNGTGYYSIIGKITSTEKVGDVDLFFENIEEFLGSEKIAQALENAEIKEDTKKGTKLSKEAKAAQEKLEKLEAEQAKLDEQIEEEGKPSADEIDRAKNEIASEDSDGFIEGDWGEKSLDAELPTSDGEINTPAEAEESLQQKLSGWNGDIDTLDIDRELEVLRNDLLEMEGSDDLLANLKQQFNLDRDFNSNYANAPSRDEIGKVLENFELLGFTLNPDSSVARRYTAGPQKGELLISRLTPSRAMKLAEIYPPNKPKKVYKDETKATSRAKDYLFFVDFSSSEKVLETIEAMTAPEGESEAMRLRSLLSAFGLEWTGGSTVKSKGSANPKEIASAMRTIFSEIIRGEVSTLRKGTAPIRPEHIQSFAAVYMENFEAGKDKIPTAKFPRKSHKFLKQISEMQSPDKQIQDLAKSFASDRVKELEDKRRALSGEIKKQQESVKAYVDGGAITEENALKLKKFRDSLDEQVKLGEVSPEDATIQYQNKILSLSNLDAQRQPGQKNTLGGNALEMIDNDQRDDKEGFENQTSEDAIEGGDSSEANLKGGADPVASGTTIETDELGNKIQVQAEDTGGNDLASFESEKAIRFQDMSTDDMVALVVAPKFLNRFLKVLESHTAEKRDQAEDGRHAEVVDEFIAFLYESNLGTRFKYERLGSSEFITDFNQIADDKKLPMRVKIHAVLEITDKLNLKAENATNRSLQGVRAGAISRAQEALTKNAEPWQIFENVLNAIGHHTKSDGYKSFTNLINDFAVVPVVNAINLEISDLIPLIDPDGLYNQEELLDALNEVYESDLKYEESAGELLLRDHLRKIVNPSYIVTQESASSLTQFQANIFENDGLEDGKLNSGQQRIDNLVDPVTGEVTKDQVIVVSEATNKESIQNARSAKQSYMAPIENPLSGHPDLLQEGRSAMEKFAPMGMDIPFSLTTALNQLKNSKLGTIANISRLLDNSTLKEFTVEFMSWDKFRKYASPAKGILNKAVILHEQKKIIISDAFNNSYRHTAEDTLASDILHEAVHAVTRPALDLGFAYSSGKQDLINDMIEQHGMPEKYNMNAEALGKVWNDINGTLLPYLREQGKDSLKKLYGLTSIDEFFSELASDPEFQNFLANTELPKSMRPARSKLRTVLDYIFNLLAKLGFKTAQTPDALTYARGELAKLTEISNSSTELTEQIAAANLRNISTLAATFKKTDINLDYHDLLERISQETARDGTGGTLEDAASHLGGSTTARKDDTGGEIISPKRKEEQHKEALKYAEENGLLINDKEFQDKHNAYSATTWDSGGSESDIYVDIESQRVFKRNTLSIHDGDIVAYLNRLVIHNLLFPSTAYKLEGFIIDKYESWSTRVVVSQPHIKGYPALSEDIQQHIANLGLPSRIGPGGTIVGQDFGSGNIKLGNDINLSDLRPDNAIKDADGNIHIIDPIIEQESVLAKILEAKLDKLDDPGDILNTIFDLYNIPGYVPGADIKALKRSAEDELGITGEESGLNALMNAVMGGTVQGNQFTPVLAEKVKDGKKIPLTEALDSIGIDLLEKGSGSMVNPVYGEAMRLMSDLLRESPMGKKATFRAESLEGGNAGAYNLSRNDVVVDEAHFRWGTDGAELLETILHEAWHALTSPMISYKFGEPDFLNSFSALGNNTAQTLNPAESFINKTRIKSRAKKLRKNSKYKASVENLEKIRKFIISRRDPIAPLATRSQPEIDLDYFLSDITEMPTMAFSNLNVADYLISQKISKEEFDSLGLDLSWHDKGLLVDITLFDLMMRWVMKALGVSDTEYNGSVLEAVAKEINIITKEERAGKTEGDVFLGGKIKYKPLRTTAQGNQFKNPTSNDSPRPANARPDDNALVMAEANAAGFNELIKELVKVHRIYGEQLGMELDEFLETYGRPGSTKIADIKQLLDKELSQHDKTSDGITLDDAGLNKIARSWGVRKAIMNLEKVREKARKEGSRSTLLVEGIEQDVVDSRNMYVDLLQGRFPSRDKLGERVKSRLNSTKFEVLQEYVKALPNSGFSQADLKSISSISLEEILGIMDAVVDAVDQRGNGEIDFLSKEDFNKQIESLTDPRLNVIKGDSTSKKAKRFAVMRAIRESKDAMSILRLSKGKIGTTEERFKDAATAIAKAKSKAEIDRVEVKFPGTLSTPIKHFARLKEQELESLAKLEQEKARQEINAKINTLLENRSIRLRMALGELQPVNIHDGVTLITMKQVNGKWERASFKVEIKNGKFKDRDGFAKANKDTLMFVRDPDMIKEHGHEPWFEIMREQALMALTEPIMEEQFHIQRAAWYAGLQGLTERFAKLGYEGKKLSQMSTATVATYRNYASQSQAYAKQFNASLHRVMAKLKLGGNEIYTGLYQDIFWWFDNHPEYAGKEEEGFAKLWKHLKANANISDRSLLDDEARRLIIDMVNKSLTARDWEAEVNKRLNNRVRDEDVQVESFINGEMTDLYRLPMDMGYATLPRSLNNGYIRDTYSLMKKANWHGEEVDGLLGEARQLKTPEGMEDIYKVLFNTQIIERFVKPYTNTDVRQSVFRGPKDDQGDMLPLGNSFISTAFEKTGGDIYAMSNYIFDQLSENTSESARVQWQYGFLNQFFKRFKELEGVAKRISNQVDGMQSGDSMRNTPQSLDARGVENRLPKEFFSYNMYDEVSSNIRLALMSATSHFGRNGDNANAAFRDGKATLGEAAETFNAIMAEATNSDHSKPHTHYSRSVKRKAYDIMRRRGSTDAEKEWNELYSKSIARGEMDVAFNHLGKYYGKGNVAGPYQDANLLMDILGVQSMSVLNNPKSSFFQALSLFEYPNAFRGLNKIAGKATVSALSNLVNQTFGGVVEAFGVELDKTSRYAQYLNDTHFNMKEMELPFSEYNSMIGSGGDLAETIRKHPALGMKKYIRYIKNLSTHHKQNIKDGTRAPIDPLSLITGIFPYVNNVVNHSVGVGAIHTYSDLVLQAAKVIEERGLTEYTELSAKDLGMGNKLGEWILGEEDGYIRANEMLVNSGAPSVSRLAFDYLDRRKSDKQALPIDERMGLLINQAAMNNVSGEGFNSKPSALYTNDFLKYFSTFLGWPLGKMSRDLDQIFRDPSDRIGTMRALMKYIGMMSAVYVPTGLSFAMLIDWYDEEMLEKPNNLPPISPWAALPVIGPFIAADDPNFTVYAITSRMAKAGVPFGMGMDIANGIFAKGDPFGAAREISLDSRIFAWSMFKNIYDAMGTWAIAGEFDWQMVGRPIAYGVGGNSVIQMMDLTSAMFNIDSEERRVANYIGMRNTIKKTAFLMGLPLRAPRKGGGVQTGVSINTRQMARAAFAGDSESFLENYQEALDAAKIYLDEKGRDDDPAKYVADAFKDRTIQGNITQGTMKDADWLNLLNIIDPDERSKIEQAIASHEHYLKLIGGTPRVSREKTTNRKLEEARRAHAQYYTNY